MDKATYFEKLLSDVKLPRFYEISCHIEQPEIACIEKAVREAISGCSDMERIRQGDKVAIAMGSREIWGSVTIGRELVKAVRERGGNPFIVAAMGSHGGATEEGQRAILSHLGITQENIGAPISAGMETVLIGRTTKGFDVYMDKAAFESDHIIPVGRIKPHTDFRGPAQSGLMKMLAIGLGKQHGAFICHKLGFPRMGESVWEFGSVILEKAPVLFAMAVVENGNHRPAVIEAVPANRIRVREPQLLEYAKSLMPKVPFDPLDVLLISEAGKEISGAGMDPNVTGRSAFLGETTPHAEKIAVLELTDASDGNASGIGNADAITRSFYNKLDLTPMYINGITCRDTQGVRIPAVMETEALALKFCLNCCIRRDALPDPRVFWMRSTARMERAFITKALLPELESAVGWSLTEKTESIPFDECVRIFREK